MHVVAAFVIAAAALSCAYQAAQFLAAWRFLRRPRRPIEADADQTFTPPITVLKPLKGPGLDLYANLASFCRQDYPEYEIVFGVSDRNDPAIAVVERLRRDFPHRRLVLVIGDTHAKAAQRQTANGKIANLIRMMPHARHDVLVMSDADIRVRPDYLRAMVAPLADPRVGLSTCLYRGRGYFGLPSVLESLFINTHFVPMILLDQFVQRFRRAYGASIALRREALERIGGFAPIADHLADDNLLGRRVSDAGYRLVLLPYVVETVLDATTMADVWRHQLRWARTYRVCQPVGWFFSMVTQTVSWGVLAVLVTRGSTTGWLVLAASLACRLGSLAGTLQLLRERDMLRRLWLVPLYDLGYSILWTASWLSREVNWSGERLHVGRDGRMTPVPAARRASATVTALTPAVDGGRRIARR